jgi:hypothetical protein
MKTAEEIYNQVILDIQRKGQSPSLRIKEIVLKTAQLYTEQAIERCAEVATVEETVGYKMIIVNQQSILNVKQELK